MNLHRRTWIQTSLQVLLASAALPAITYSKARFSERQRVVAFDALAVFDAAPVVKALEANFPGRGKQLATAWRTRIFDSAWIHTLGQHYIDFAQACAESLRHTMKTSDLSLDAAAEAKLLRAWSTLEVYPDVRGQLALLRNAGVKVGFLSNMTKEILDANVHANQLDGAFDFTLSTDVIGKYKPDPAAYALVTDTLKVARDDVTFVPSADWDLAGGKWFGYRTYWVNRTKAPTEGFGAAADLEAPDLAQLARFVLAHS